ncbi:MAG: hypothetical protein U9Q05_02550 [Thermodesulfobacteriota bacterium]|nr:hypothetical protein [Thermodesulfobacteriota bacterium]
MCERAPLERALEDTNTGMPDRLEESGFGSAEAQLRWRFFRETERLPEWYFLDAGRVTAKLKSED